MSEQPLNVPHIIADRYAIEREVGRGGMAVVYFAKDLRHFRDVAIKIFRREGNEPDEGSERFLQEIKIAARLSHPNILPLHDSGDDHGLLFYVMPYVPGESLRQRLEREGALPLADALTIATDIANALAYAHSHGVIHRDIKPENILFIAGNAVVADFGIARAISAGGWDEWKLAGPAGTPAYMSPEQGRGGSRVDGRSDLYSLGCVLYEMLTGEPPFRGNTPEELVAQHLEVEPQPISSIRPTLPRDVQLAVGRALAKHPADRYQTALQMAEALGRLQVSTSGEHEQRSTPAGPVLAERSTPPFAAWLRRWGGPSFIAAGLAAAVFWTTGAVKTSALDPNLLLIGPFVHRAGVPAGLDGDQCSRLITQAVDRWEDIRAADPRWAGDQLARLGHEAALSDLIDVARDGGAGRLLSGEVWTGAGDTLKVRGVVYDVRRGSRALREYTVSVAPDLSDLNERFSELADSLLLPSPQSAASVSGILGTRNTLAWLAYDSGHAALARWDLAGARTHFVRASAIDPNYQLAYLWTAQTRSWQGYGPSQWREDVRRGIQDPAELSSRDREWARAMLALAENRFPDACTQFNDMLKRDSLDFRAWYGRGDCRARDPIVIRDPRTKSGFAFRSSYAAAIRDYSKALTLVPLSHQAFRGGAFQRLMGTMYAQDNRMRRGWTQGGDSLPFFGLPTIEGDTLAFTAWSPADIADNEDAWPPSHQVAVRRNQEQLQRITATWTRDFPTSVTALRAQAQLLEIMGQIDSMRSRTSALSLIQQARGLSTDSVETVELAAIKVRLLFKLQHFGEARQLAESLFARVATDPTAGQELVGIAVLLGRPSLAGRLTRMELTRFSSWLGQPVTTPSALRESGARLLAFASVGAPRDSIERLTRLVQQQIRSYTLPEERSGVRSAVLDHATILLSEPWNDPLFQPEAQPEVSAIREAVALRKGDTASVRAELVSGEKAREGERPWVFPPEHALRTAQTYLALGDTANAIAPIDNALPALDGLSDLMMTQISQTGAMVRLMLFRMEIARERGDLSTAQRWARAATELWANAEPGLQPQLATARQLLK